MSIRIWPITLIHAAALAASPASGLAPRGPDGCPSRPTAGSPVTDPISLRSVDGELRVDLAYRNSIDAAGQMHYCYVYKGSTEAPTLRLHPGDLLVLHLKNELTTSEHPAAAEQGHGHAHSAPGACATGAMTPVATNLHFHGLSVPPVCHQDDVLNTLIASGGPPFEYRFRIPDDQTPGLYWYHPHVHGMTSPQVLGGASGALIVEGLERATPAVAGLPERVFVIRDQDLLNPAAQPVQTDSMPAPLVLRDAEGDILNTGTGGGKPAKDLSINFVPVPYPRYGPASIEIRPGERQLWRVLNGSAITYLDLQLLAGAQPQPLGVVALDGAPFTWGAAQAPPVLWQSHILLPPAARAEFIVKGPPAGTAASLVTRTVDTGPAGENDPTRPLARVISRDDAPEPLERLSAGPAPPLTPSGPPLRSLSAVKTRKLYFSERLRDPQNPSSPTEFTLTVEGQEPKPFDPHSATPNLTVQQGDVEDWTIENRTRELHAFHIHQIRFMLLEWNGVPLDEPFLRDTINVAYWDGRSQVYPAVKLRMDFRDPHVIGTFVYHCHLLEHEDGGMMGLVQVIPAPAR